MPFSQLKDDFLTIFFTLKLYWKHIIFSNDVLVFLFLTYILSEKMIHKLIRLKTTTITHLKSKVQLSLACKMMDSTVFGAFCNLKIVDAYLDWNVGCLQS